jgi:hypothetical protein
LLIALPIGGRFGALARTILVTFYAVFGGSTQGVPVSTGTETSGSGRIAGVVVNGSSNQAVGSAIVTLRGPGQELRLLTDGAGQFAFSDLQSADYSITASKRGYADGAYGRRRAGGESQSLALGDNERVTNVRIALWEFGVITGSVVDETGEPIVDLPVQVLARSFLAGRPKLSPAPATRTDDRGIYRIRSLLPGDYVIAVPSTQTTAPESIVDQYQQAKNSGSASEFWGNLISSGATAGLDVLVSKGGLTVSSFFFQPSIGAIRGASLPTPSRDGRISVYPTTYFPGVATATQAAVLRLNAGDERSGVDVQMRLVATARVSGSIAGPEGPLSVGLALTSTGDDLATDVDLEVARTVSDASGRFTFLGVPAGQYNLRMVRSPIGAGRGLVVTSASASLMLWATQAVSVGTSDVTDLRITAQPGFLVTGRLEFEGGERPAPEAVRRISGTVETVDGRSLGTIIVTPGRAEPTDMFSTIQLPPGRYYLRVANTPAGWSVRSIILAGRDVSSVPFALEAPMNGAVIALTKRPSELTGRVVDDSGRADVAATVLVFPATPSSWVDYGKTPTRLRTVRVYANGSFRTTGLPAGDYLVVAVHDEDISTWQDPAFLEVLARSAKPMRIVDAESRFLELKTTTLRR